MNLYQCENKAKDIGFDKAKFWAVTPKGPILCQWVDAYFGLFKLGENEGFVTVRQVDEMFPDLECSEPFLDE